MPANAVPQNMTTGDISLDLAASSGASTGGIGGVSFGNSGSGGDFLSASKMPYYLIGGAVALGLLIYLLRR